MYNHIPQETLIQGIAKQHLNAFSPKFFKTKWLNNKRSIQNIYRNKRFLSDVKLPAVTISYEIKDDPNETLLNTDFPYNYASQFIAAPFTTFYHRLYCDTQHHCTIFAAVIRKKITLTFQYLFADSYMRDDVHDWLLNTFRYGQHPQRFSNHMSIYAALPTNMLEYLAAAYRHPLDNTEEKQEFDAMLTTYSWGNFRKKKLTLEDSFEAWFLVYQLPMLDIFHPQRPEKDEGALRGQTKTRFGLTEVVEFEPYIPSMYLTKIPHVINGVKTPDSYKPGFYAPNDMDPRIYEVINLVADPIPKDVSPLQKYMLPMVSIEFGSTGDSEEVITIDETLLGKKYLFIIRELYKRGRVLEDYITILLYAFNQKLFKTKDYTIDWNTLQLTILKPHTSYIYRLVMLIDRRSVEGYLSNYQLKQERQGEHTE
jgi:hypothetical protein